MGYSFRRTPIYILAEDATNPPDAALVGYTRVVDFGTSDAVYFLYVTPDDWDQTSDFHIVMAYAGDTAVSGADEVAKLEIVYKSIADGDLLTKADESLGGPFTATITLEDTYAANTKRSLNSRVANSQYSAANFRIKGIDSTYVPWPAGRLISVKLTRLSAGDTYAGKFRLIWLSIEHRTFS